MSARADETEIRRRNTIEPQRSMVNFRIIETTGSVSLFCPKPQLWHWMPDYGERIQHFFILTELAWMQRVRPAFLRGGRLARAFRPLASDTRQGYINSRKAVTVYPRKPPCRENH